MHVVVASAVDEQQISLQSVGPVDGRAVLIALGIVLRSVHVAFLIDGVVEALVGHESHGNARLEHFGIAEHAVERLAPTAAPACDADALGVDEGELACQVENASCLVFAGKGAHLAVDALAPLPATRGCSTAILDAHHDVAQAGQILMPRAARPHILHGRTGWLAIHVDNHGIFLAAIEVVRLDHPGIEHQFARTHLHELLGLYAQLVKLLLGLAVVHQCPDRLGRGERLHLYLWHRAGIAEGVDSPCAGGRHVVVVLSLLRGIAHQFAPSVAEQFGAIQIPLCGIVGRSNEIHVAALLVQPHLLYHVEVTLRDAHHLPSVGTHSVQVPPSVPLTHPREPLAFLQPLHPIVRLHPRAVRVLKDVPQIVLPNRRCPHLVAVLRSVHLLDEQLVRAWHKLHPRQVVVALITGNRQPSGRASLCTYIPHLHSTVRRASLGVGEVLHDGVDAIHVVDDVKPSRAARVALPVGYVPSVATPTETVATAELLLIHPVERAVHNGVTPVCGDGSAGLCLQILHINVVAAHVGHLARIGRELGKHQAALRQSLTQLIQRARLAVQHPVVATSVIAPHFLRVRKQQHLLLVMAE